MTCRVMFYVQHLLGIGHLKRASLIARGMAAAGLDVSVVLGGREVPALISAAVPASCCRRCTPPTRPSRPCSTKPASRSTTNGATTAPRVSSSSTRRCARAC